MVAAGRGLLVDRLEAVERRDDVEEGGALDVLGMVAQEAVRDPGAAVVPGHPKPLMPKRRHRLDLVPGERALRIGRMVGGRRRL